MSTHKTIDRICVIAIVVALLLTILCINREAMGVQSADNTIGYENHLFDTSKVHTIDIVMEDWDSFIASAQSEEYSVCTVVIDGETYKSVGIRGKGNTSLSTVSSMGSDRYSFKIEFDQYDSTKSYYGLDKLSLNNIIQDATYMKDYLTYRLMGQFGVAAPLCSYVYITVNGEDWGLYLAVEAVEDAFLQRNYGTDYGELYKPDSMSMGGGRGNGMNFNMEELAKAPDAAEDGSENAWRRQDGDFFDMPGSLDPSSASDNGENSSSGGGGNVGVGEFGMDSSDVKLQYIDDDPASYKNIFNNAKTDVTEADQARLIEALKSLSAGENMEDIVDVEAVIRYFVVHNFVCNEDSYTGSVIHNYYLYEEDGQLSMIPWDYNLAYGTHNTSNATDAVNSPIDSPVYRSTTDDRPMVNWIFTNEAYTEQYHEYFARFLETSDFAAVIDETAALIALYVKKDSTAFYSYEEFEAGVATLREFCLLRAESVRGQLNGTIPSTEEGQAADDSALVDASHLTLSDMGSMGGGMGGGGFGGGNRGDHFQGIGKAEASGFTPPGVMDSSQVGSAQMPPTEGGSSMAPGRLPSGEGEMPGNFSGEGNPQQSPGGQQMPGGMVIRPSANAGDSLQPGGFSGSIPGTANQTRGGSSLILFAVSVAVLLLGLIIAFKFKR